MGSLDFSILRKAAEAGRIEWRKHALQMLLERGLSREDILHVLLEGEQIHKYDDDRPYPSALFLGYPGGKPVHVVASCDDATGTAFIITAYQPSLTRFESDYRTRRSSE